MTEITSPSGHILSLPQARRLLASSIFVTLTLISTVLVAWGRHRRCSGTQLDCQAVMLEIQGPSVTTRIRSLEERTLFSLRNKVRIFYVCAGHKDSFHIFRICLLLTMHGVPQTHRQWVIKANYLSTTQFKPQSELLVFKVIKKSSLWPSMNPSIFCVFIPLTLYLIYSKTCFPKILNLQMKKTPIPIGFKNSTVFLSTDATCRCASPTGHSWDK